MSTTLENAILYHNLYSPPSRMAYLAVRNLNIDLQIRDLDITGGEQNTPDFLKINPMHQVPTLVHDGFVVTESRAIMLYLASLVKSPLYPESDLKRRTLVQSRLFFDATNGSLVVKNLAFPVIRRGAKIIPPGVRENIVATVKNLDILLKDSEWFAGDEISIADLAILANVATIKFFGVDLSEYPKLNAWYDRCRKVPGFKENEEGAKMLANKLKNLLDEPLWK